MKNNLYSNKQQYAESKKQKQQKTQSHSKSLLFNNQTLTTSVRNTKIKTKPQYIKEYAQFLQLSLESQNLHSFHSFQYTQKLYKKLKEADLQICNSFVSKLTILAMHHSKNFQIVELTVQMSNIKMSLSILNTDQQQIIEDQLYIHKSGAFGTIYFCQFCSQNYAIKKNTLNNLLESIRQYFFARVFSALQIGPKIKNIFGTDLIVNYRSVYFSMEICQQFKYFNKEDLKILMKTMHCLKIVHRDIKPSNLMYSKQYDTCVFIDFGGCTFIQQEIGEKSLTIFYGTLQYCSQQMKKLKDNCNIIDLYYNDMYAIKLVIDQTKFQLRCFQSKSNQPYFSFANSKHLSRIHQDQQVIPTLFKFQCFILKCKSFMWSKNTLELTKFIHKWGLKEYKQFQGIILQFMTQLVPSKNLIQFYFNQISQQTKNKESFNILLRIYTNQFTFTYEYMLQKYMLGHHYRKFAMLYLKISQSCQTPSHYRKKALNYKILNQSMSDRMYKQELSKLQKVNQMKAEYYYMLILDYITFTENYFQAQLQQKIRVCEVFLQSVRQPLQTQQQFDIQDKSQIPIVKTFLYLLQNGVWQVKDDQKILFYLTIFKNLFLLGIRISRLQQFAFLLEQKMKMTMKYKFLYLWKFLALFEFYHEKSLDMRKSTLNKNTGKQENQEIKNQVNQCKQQTIQQEKYCFNIYKNFVCKMAKLFQIQTQDPDENYFKQFNKTIFSYLHNQICFESQKNRLFFLTFLKNSKIFQEFTQDQYLDFSLSVISTLKFLPYYQDNFYLKFNFSQFLKPTLNSFKYKQIPINFPALIQGAQDKRQYNKMSKLFNYFDKIVNAQTISNRYLIQFRLSLAYHQNDQTKIKTIVQMIGVLENKRFVSYCRFLNRYLGSLNSTVIILPQKILKAVSAQIIVKCLKTKSNQVIEYVEQTILKYYNLSLNNTLDRSISYILQELFTAIKFFFQFNNKNNTPKNSYQQFFYLKRLQFIKQISQKMFKCLQIFPFFLQFYIQIIHKIYSQNIQHQTFMKMIQNLYKIRPEKKQLIECVKDQSILKRSQVIMIIYVFQSKFELDNQDVQNFQNILTLYSKLVNGNQLFYLCSFNGLLYKIWKGLTICCTSNEQKFYFFVHIITYLKQNNSILQVYRFHIAFCKIFESIFCNSKKEIYQPTVFLQYLMVKLDKQMLKNSYWSLIFYYCLQNKEINQYLSLDQVRKWRLIKYINKSLDNIKTVAKSIILDRFYQIVANAVLSLNKNNKMTQSQRESIKYCKLSIKKRNKKYKFKTKNQIVCDFIVKKFNNIKQNNRNSSLVHAFQQEFIR